MHIKHLAVGALTLAATLAIAGCSSSTPTSPTTSSAPVAAPTSSTAAVPPTTSAPTTTSAAPVTLEMSWWGDATRAALFHQVIQGFTAKYPNITVTETPVGSPDDLFNRLSTDFASGGSTAPDVFALGGAMPQQYGASGNLLALDTPDIAGAVKLDKYPKDSLTNGIVNDTVYALPTGGNATAMFINTDIMSKAGVTLPTGQWTWTNLVDIANQVGKAGLTTDDSKAIMGIDLRIQDILGTYCGQLTQYGMYTPEGTLGVTAENIASWYDLELKLRDGGGLPDPSVVTANWALPADQQPFTLGQAGITFGYSNLVNTYNKGGAIQIVAPPTDTSTSGVALLPSAFWAVNAATKHPAEAAALVDWFLNQPDAAKLILDTRGVPFNPDIAAVVAQAVTGDAQKADAYVASVLSSGVVAPPQPNGGANMNQYSQDQESNVLFDKSTPAKAAADWIKALGDDLAAAK